MLIKNPWIMHYILCHNNPINAMNPRTQARKRLISYFKTNGTLNKHVDANHGLVVKVFEEKVKNLLREKRKGIHKKISQFFFFKSYLQIFCLKDPFKKDDV